MEISFNKSKRQDLYEIDEDVPGPDKYNPKEIDNRILLSFSKEKRKEFGTDDLRQTPGP